MTAGLGAYTRKLPEAALGAPLLPSEPTLVGTAPPHAKRCAPSRWAAGLRAKSIAELLQGAQQSQASALRLLLAVSLGYTLGWANGSGLEIGGVAASALGPLSGCSLEALLEASATVLSGCFFLSPAVQVAGVVRSGGASLAEVSPQTIIFMLCNCALWTAWGLYAPMLPAVPVNAFGLLAAAGFLAVCWGFVLSRRADAPAWGRGAAAGTVAALTLIPCCFFYASTSPLRAEHVGDLAMLICILMYASPLSVVRQVIADRSSDLLPPAQCVMQAANCLAWMAVGANSHVVQVLVCNGLGLALGVLQLALLATFPYTKGGHAPPEDVQVV